MPFAPRILSFAPPDLSLVPFPWRETYGRANFHAAPGPASQPDAWTAWPRAPA